MESGPPAWWTSTVPKIPDLGVTEVYSGPKEGGVVADIFIVHGLQVHPEDTWTSKVEHSASSAKKSGGWRKRFFGGSRPTDSSANDTSTTPTCARRGCFWPFDLLPHTLHKARVLVYGYDSHPTYFYKGGTTRMTITAHCEDLMHKVAAMRVECRGRPIIFIAHSLGGILVKGALNEARQMTHQPQYLDIQQSSFAIMFMGTPHQGADYAKWGEMLSNIVGALPGGFSTDSSILRELSPDSETLDGIARRFDEMLDQSIPVPDKVKICSVQEGKGMSAVKGAGSKVVPDWSSKFNRTDVEQSFFNQEANHMDMCKFSDEDDSAWKDVSRVLKGWLHDIEQNRQSRNQQQAMQAKAASTGP